MQGKIGKSALQKSKDMPDGKRIAGFIDLLRDKDGLRRQKARFSLEKIGKEATPFLIGALSDRIEHCRWEAAKTLISIKDPQAAPALVEALMDKSFEIQWLAAEALIALRTVSVPPLLKALIEHSDSADLQQGAHHVLHALERERLLDERTVKVLDALRSLDADVWVITAAQKALKNR